MDLDELAVIRQQIADVFQESPGSDVAAMIADIERAIGASPLFASVVARKTGVRNFQIDAYCEPADPDTSAAGLVQELERIWEAELRYDDYAAYAVAVHPSSIAFEFITASKSARVFVSGLITVDLSN